MTFLVFIWQGSDEEISDSECDGESGTSEGSSFDTSVQSRSSPASSPDVLQKLIIFMTGLRLLMSSAMNTAGKVLVTVLLGLAGNAYKYESVYAFWKIICRCSQWCYIFWQV